MSDYYSDTLIPFVDNLVRDYKSPNYELDFYTISDDDKKCLAAHLLESDDRDLFSLTENEHYEDIVSSLINLLKKDNIDHKLDFSDTVSNNLVLYYEKRMKEIIENRLIYLEKSDYEEKLYKRCFHADNGEFFWVKDTHHAR